MDLLPHIAVSAAIGAGVWAATGEANALPAALGAGVLPDLDHIPDYYLRYVRGRWGRLFIVLHGWEYAAAGAAVYALWVREPWMLAVVLGYLSQVGSDQVFNRVKWHTYFLALRAARGFRVERVLNREDVRSYMSIVRSAPFGKARLKRWLEERIARSFPDAGQDARR
jgi:hypothetical protein